MCAKNSHKKRFFAFFFFTFWLWLHCVKNCYATDGYLYVVLLATGCLFWFWRARSSREMGLVKSLYILVYSSSSWYLQKWNIFSRPIYFCYYCRDHKLRRSIGSALRALFKLCKQLKHFLMLLITNINLCCHVGPPLQIVLLFCLFFCFWVMRRGTLQL